MIILIVAWKARIILSMLAVIVIMITCLVPDTLAILINMVWVVGPSGLETRSGAADLAGSPAA